MTRHNPTFLKWLLIIGVTWGQVILIGVTVNEPTPENLTLLFSIEASGLYTLGLYLTRDRWMPRLAQKPLRNAILLGIGNAVIIETVFLLFEKLFGAAGIAAHPNLLVDLLLTMPWYILMVISFSRIQERYQYSDAAVLLIGAVYELGADGIVGGQVMPILSGEVVLLLENWIMLILVSLWQFVLVYSSMFLPGAWLLEGQRQTSINRAVRWLRPMVWLIPYTLYLITLLVLLFAPSI